MAVERKYERDVDLLLAEEISVNPAFADWLKKQTAFGNRDGLVTDVFVSRSDNLGESDLIALFSDATDSRFALMIEDKVDAPIQPDQANRYRLRAERDVARGEYSAFSIILCAPRYYIDRSLHTLEFDAAVSFEEIAGFLRSNDPSARGQYRATFLETAATRRVNNWSRDTDDETNAFWDAAYRLASTDFPILEMKPPKVTRGSTWINFRPTDMPTPPKRHYVSVKGDRGQMDLTFSGVSAHHFQSLIKTLLEPDMTVHQTSASAAIRIETSGFRPSDGWETGMPKVREAVEASARLIGFYRANREALIAAAREAAN